MIDPIEAIAFYAVFVFAVTVHEASHAWAAMIGGDLTAYHGGQVSLDPIPHMKRETFGMVILPILTLATIGWPMGYASAPYSVDWARRYPKRAAWMALAGPASNLALAIVAAVIVRVGVSMGTFEAPMSIHFRQITMALSETGEVGGLAAAFAMLLSLFFSMNLLLFLLNMIPFPPLDGAGALPLILPESWVENYQGFAQNPMFSIIGLILMWNLIGEIFYPVFYAAVGLLYPGVSYS